MIYSISEMKLKDLFGKIELEKINRYTFSQLVRRSNIFDIDIENFSDVYHQYKNENITIKELLDNYFERLKRTPIKLRISKTVLKYFKNQNILLLENVIGTIGGFVELSINFKSEKIIDVVFFEKNDYIYPEQMKLITNYLKEMKIDPAIFEQIEVSFIFSGKCSVDIIFNVVKNWVFKNIKIENSAFDEILLNLKSDVYHFIKQKLESD